MSAPQIENGEEGLTVRTKLNDALTAVYTGGVTYEMIAAGNITAGDHLHLEATGEVSTVTAPPSDKTYLGIAANTAATGEVVRVMGYGCVADGFSGLIPDEYYYLDEVTAAMGADGETTVGLALTSTKILIGGNWN